MRLDTPSEPDKMGAAKPVSPAQMSRQRSSGFTEAEERDKATRHENVIHLLETLNIALAGNRTGDGPGIASRGDRVLVDEKDLYHNGSYKELEACLRLLHEHGKKIHWHTVSRYRDAERGLPLTVPCVKTLKGVRVKLPDTSPEWPYHAQVSVIEEVTGKQARVRIVRWSSKVKQNEADKGVRFLARMMKDVNLPVEFLGTREAA